MSQELAERTDGGTLVRLLWSPAEDAVRLEVYDLHTGEAFTSPVPKAEAMQAFDHPHLYRPRAAAGSRGRTLAQEHRRLAGVVAGADSVWDIPPRSRRRLSRPLAPAGSGPVRRRRNGHDPGSDPRAMSAEDIGVRRARLIRDAIDLRGVLHRESRILIVKRL